VTTKLNFSLVSPEREIYSGEVDQVDIPGAEGDMGLLPNHSPLMAGLRVGAITIYADGIETQYLVQGGFADVTPEGLTVLAEKALPMDEVTAEYLGAHIESATTQLAALTGEEALAVQKNIDGLKLLADRLQSGSVVSM